LIQEEYQGYCEVRYCNAATFVLQEAYNESAYDDNDDDDDKVEKNDHTFLKVSYLQIHTANGHKLVAKYT